MRKDPENLPTDCKPVLVHRHETDDLYPANHNVQSSGWLWVELWDGTRLKLPPQGVESIETVETVRKSDEASQWKEIKEPELCQRAKNIAGIDQQRQTVVADGGKDPHPDAGGGSR